MRTNSSPTAIAARRLAAIGAQPKANQTCTPATESRWCEWPRRVQSNPPRAGIWQTLQQIQARHA